MNSFLDILHTRRPALNYTTPAICEAIFSASGFPVLVLDALGAPGAISGLIVTYYGSGGLFKLYWNIYPGALCYSVYKVNDATDPYGEYSIVAECISDPEYNPVLLDPEFDPDAESCYLVSAITLTGETFLSDPICTNPGGTGGSPPPGGGGGEGTCPLITAEGATPLTYTSPDMFTIGPVTVDEGTGPVVYEWWKDDLFFLDTTATTQNSLEVAISDAEHAGSYVLKVINSTLGCTATSAPIVVDECPRITEEVDTPQYAVIGEDKTVGPVGVHEGTGPVTYVWYKNSAWYEDTTETTQGSLELTNVQAGDLATYELRVTNTEHGCFVDSAPIELLQTVCPDWDSLSFSVFGGGSFGAGFSSFVDGGTPSSWTQFSEAPDGSTDGSSLQQLGTLTHTGGECNCNIEITVTKVGSFSNLCGSVWIKDQFQSYVLVDLYLVAPGTYNYPFTLADGTGTPRNVEVHVVTQAPCLSNPAGLQRITQQCVITNV